MHDPKLGLLLLGRYRIVRKLGEGGMGTVYEGLHELIGKRLAIKCLHPQYVSNREVVERFYREAQSATAVGNEHIIEVTDIGNFDDGAPFLVMEFLDGIELARLIDQAGTLPIARVVHIVNQVCSALAAAHARGIVHRDIKPENIYLVKRGSDSDFVKVLDFGISKVRESNENLGGGLTRTGMTLGTPYYMAPEQAQAVRDIDHRADVYSVGVILYQALTGHLPFDAESYPALMLKIMSEKPAPIRAFRTDVPEALEQVVSMAMARDRTQRFQSVEALAQALAPFAVLKTLPPVSMTARTGAPIVPQTTPFVTTHESGTPAVPAQPARGRTLRAAAAGALALAGLGAWLLTRTPESAPDAPAPALPLIAPAATAQPAAPAVMAAAAATQPVQAPAQRSEVQVKISATPSEARIFIGDVEFPNPMDAYRPRSLDPIRIRIEARGHESVEQLAIFDQDRHLSFSLAPGRGVRRLDAVGAPKTPASTPKPVAVAAPPPKPEAPPKAAPPEAPAAPDGVYHGPTGKIRDDF